jgi:hypothetical protein
MPHRSLLAVRFASNGATVSTMAESLTFSKMGTSSLRVAGLEDRTEDQRCAAGNFTDPS